MLFMHSLAHRVIHRSALGGTVGVVCPTLDLVTVHVSSIDPTTYECVLTVNPTEERY